MKKYLMFLCCLLSYCLASNMPPIFMQTSIQPSTIYTGQAGLYTLKIFYNTAVRAPALTIPNIDHVKLIHIGKDTNQRATINGENYQLLEQHYALIVERDGVLNINSPSLHGYSLDTQARNSAKPAWREFKITAPAVSIKINPIPGMARAIWWLPSTKVTITDSWADATPTFINGMPVTRTLTLTAQNVTAAQLPNIAPQKSSGFQLYPDQPSLKTDSNGFQLQASRVEKIAYLPIANGTFTIPAIKIDWWNTDNNTPQQLTLAAYPVNIAASYTNNNILTPNQLSLQDNIIATSNVKKFVWYKHPFVILSILLAIAWIVTVLLWWHTTRKQAMPKRVIAIDDKIKTMRQLRADLRKACQQNNAVDAKMALLAIGKELWPYETILSVGDLCEKFQFATTSNLLQELECVLYKEETIWHGLSLWLAVDEELQLFAKNSTDPADVLPKLYLEEK